jgi:hypothetical protein
VRQAQLQLQLVGDGNPLGVALRNLRLQSAAGVPDGVSVQRNELHPPALIQLQGAQVVVGRDQPEPPATGGLGDLANGVEQGAAYTPTFARCRESDDFTLLPPNRIGEEARSLAVEKGDKGRQMRRVDKLATTSHERAAPGGCVIRRCPLSILVPDTPHLYHN